MLRLGRAYRYGKGVTKNLEKSVILFEKASKKIPWVRNELMGTLWEIGTPDSYIKMVNLARDLIKINSGEAAVTLGRAYRDGKGVTKDPVLSAKYFNIAINNNVKWSANELYDIVVAHNLPGYNLENIINTIESLAKSGDHNSMGHMGRAYRDGKGVQKDLNRALEWMTKAIDNGCLWVKKEYTQLIKDNQSRV